MFIANRRRLTNGAGALWFTVANYALRTWPWVLIGLVGLVVFPAGAADGGAKKSCCTMKATQNTDTPASRTFRTSSLLSTRSWLCPGG